MEGITAGLTQFYADYDLFPPETPESLEAWLQDDLHHYWVAVDRDGQVLAGMAVVDEPALRDTVIIDMPVCLRLLSQVIGLVPRDGVLRRLLTGRVWFKPGHLAAAQYLWQTLRFELRPAGNMLGPGYDARDGRLKQVFQLPPWLPMVHMTVALCYPQGMLPPAREGAPAPARLMYSNR